MEIVSGRLLDMRYNAYLSEKTLRTTKGFRWVLRIAHLHTRQCEGGIVLSTQLDDVPVPVSVPSIEVACSEFGCMSVGSVPPVDACHFEGNSYRRPTWTIIHSFPASKGSIIPNVSEGNYLSSNLSAIRSFERRHFEPPQAGVAKREPEIFHRASAGLSFHQSGFAKFEGTCSRVSKHLRYHFPAKIQFLCMYADIDG